jgi:signal transduction histidine kinase
MTAPELVALVRAAAARLAERGDAAFGEFRVPGSRWLHDDVYLFALTDDGRTAFHGAHPEFEGRDEHGLTDVTGRRVGRMILEAAAEPWGEGWLHYQHPEPGTHVPAWKSSFVKRARLPDGTCRIVGCGVFHMQMDRAFIEDVVDRAAALLAREGRRAFPRLRDRTGPFVFMDTYVFVCDPFGWELVNGAFPSLEGRNLLGLHDAEGELVVGEEVAAAMANGRAWLECRWFRPGSNVPARRRVYVRKAETEDETFVVGSGFYEE